MAIEDFFTTPITILTPATRAGDYGDDTVEDWVAAEETPTFGWFTLLTAQEVEEAGRDATVTTWHLSTYADAPLTSRCRVRIDPPEYELDATTFKVDGIPAVGKNPTAHHLEAHLVLVEG